MTLINQRGIKETDRLQGLIDQALSVGNCEDHILMWRVAHLNLASDLDRIKNIVIALEKGQLLTMCTPEYLAKA